VLPLAHDQIDLAQLALKIALEQRHAVTRAIAGGMRFKLHAKGALAGIRLTGHVGVLAGAGLPGV